ncbi:MAG: sigma 54-interacting transcriptional regulator, partial [Syntrophomonadaceae bacterium]|nr:sigma 54-interacting transcriptional regulator [Syntrophomonadaceae bacterium]
MDNAEMRRRWTEMHNKPDLRDRLRPPIKYSWERSFDAGVDPYIRENAYICTEDELNKARQNAQYLLKISEPVMQDLNEFVSGTGFVVALADADCCLLKVIGDQESLSWAKSAHFVEGSLWLEKLVGTNAGCLCMDLAKPVSVFGYEHFCLFSHVSASSSAPIIDNGKICGCLSLAAPFNRVSNHTLGMVVAAAKNIMSTMALVRMNQFQTTVMDSMSEGVLALDANGNITFMNNCCAQILQLPSQVSDGNILDLLGPNLENQYFINKVTQGRTFIDENFKLLTRDNSTINCNVTCNPLNNPDIPDGGTVVIIKESQRINRLVKKWIGDGAKLTFDNIVGEDPRLLQVLKTARAAASSASNVVLLGESGTGKDVIAQAMHNASPRRDHPYVAINCAALPRDLIASELFGYDEGAFTGARKGGNVGKFELADQGTIFLDEIADIPLELQASLLRVLEEKAVIRLGGTKLIPVDVRIIAATNKDLLAEIKRHRFRRDLYYRLSVIRITIPPLRDRTADILLLAERFIDKYCRRFNKPDMTLAPDVRAAFQKYNWPGNVRELQNLIEGAIQLAPGRVITYDLVAEYLHDEELGNQLYPAEPSEPEGPTVAAMEKQMLLDYLARYQYNKSEVAKAMGISRNTLYRH